MSRGTLILVTTLNLLFWLGLVWGVLALLESYGLLALIRGILS